MSPQGECDTRPHETRNIHAVLWVQHAVIARQDAHSLYETAAQAAKTFVAAATATCHRISRSELMGLCDASDNMRRRG
jgi:hypothetical protein